MKLVNLKNVFWRFGALFFVSLFAFNMLATPALAVTGATILPETKKGVTDCLGLMHAVNVNHLEAKALFQKPFGETTTLDFYPAGSVTAFDIMGCGIKTGNIRLWLIPYYIRYILEFAIAISGLVSVGAIVYGGFRYVFAGIGNNRDEPRQAIIYGIIGSIVCLLSWAVVNIVISLFTQI